MPQSHPAWTDRQLADPHAVVDKAHRVRTMFSAIAPSYDLNNRLHSMGRDQAWRRAAVRAAQIQAGQTVIDVACGTGDLALAFAQAGAGRVVGVDYTSAMLELARCKRPGSSASRPCYICGDALHLPIADASADVISIAFGIRNVTDPTAVLVEFHRVLRPGGRAVVLEFSVPKHVLLRHIYQFYFRQIMPRTAALVAGDRVGAYSYLPRSVDTFLDRPQMLELLRRVGFEAVTSTTLTFGISVIYLAIKPTS